MSSLFFAQGRFFFLEPRFAFEPANPSLLSCPVPAREKLVALVEDGSSVYNDEVGPKPVSEIVAMLSSGLPGE
ncbi:MAG: hypothetical protein Q7R41_14465 [Phycisphaerales bacterium]|nr:hypothetical protein [Phycisphaerales bacterium]